MTTEAPALTLGEYTRNRRNELKMSLQDVATLSGISKSYLSTLESGESANISVQKLDALARALREPMEVLIRLALGRELSRAALTDEVAALLEGLPEFDQAEMLATLEAMALARRKRLGL